jgi:hypothetical protein
VIIVRRIEFCGNDHPRLAPPVKGRETPQVAQEEFSPSWERLGEGKRPIHPAAIFNARHCNVAAMNEDVRTMS